MIASSSNSSSTNSDYYNNNDPNNNKSLVPLYKNCQVCNNLTSDRIHNGIPVCSACKKFHVRNRTKINELKCLNGNNSCYDHLEQQGGDSNNAAIINNNNSGHHRIWRNICSRCRLAKCFEIGMPLIAKTVIRTKKAASPPPAVVTNVNNTSPPPVVVTECNIKNEDSTPPPPLPPAKNFIYRNPVMHQCSQVEAAIQATTRASQKILTAVNSLPLSATYNCLGTDLDNFHYFLNQVLNWGKDVQEFARNLPGVGGENNDGENQEQEDTPSPSIPENVIKMLTLKALSPIAMAKAARLTSAQPGNLNPMSEEMWRRYFPELLSIAKETNLLWSVISNWQPSASEFAFLLAFTYLKGMRSSSIGEAIDPYWRNVLSAQITNLEQAFKAVMITTNNSSSPSSSTCSSPSLPTSNNISRNSTGSSNASQSNSKRSSSNPDRLDYFRYVYRMLQEANNSRCITLHRIAQRRPDLFSMYPIGLQLLQYNLPD